MNMTALTELGPQVLLVAALNVIGVAIKNSTIPNKFIPWIMMGLGGVLWPLLADKTGPSIQAAYPLAHAVLTGILIGGTATGIYEATRTLRPSKQEPEKPAEPPQ